ncbi:TRAP transporter substrate-binding protein [Denitrificimonas caeni]|uniref:TRAP transporter substrate-binding protein n=1 Tax=Denitrificimonas caeni TaxID=521720 RepID=UPI0019628B31|nr:TRAP transporter substrate-binding protein [Denitrificimonas caeni]
MIKTTSAILGLSLTLSLTHVNSVVAAEMVWDMPNEYPSTSVQGRGDKTFSTLLKEKSAGQIKISHHFGGALGLKSKDQLDAVGDGIVQVANTFIPPLGGVDPIFLLSSLPFLSSNADEARKLFDAARQDYDRVLAKFNQRLLYSSPWPSSGIWGKEPLVSHSTIDNLKMRTYDANGTMVFRSMGSAPIQLSWADIVPQLSTGGINAVLTSIESGLSSSFNDYVTHFTAINYDSTINLVTMNRDVWEDLTPELQAAVTAAAKETEDQLWSNANEVIRKSYEEAERRGVTIVSEVPEDFRKEMKDAAIPVIESWTKKMGPNGPKILSAYQDSISTAQ